MKYRNRDGWLLLTQEELSIKPTRELLVIMQWARYQPKCSCGQDLGSCDGGLTEDEKLEVKLRFELKIRVKVALNALYNGVVRGHVPGRAEGRQLRRERQGRKERKEMRY